MTPSTSGIAVQKLFVEGHETPALMFMHSRKKQVLSCLMCLVFALAGVGMFFGAETAEFPIIGRNPTFTRGFAIVGVLFMTGMAILSIKALLSPQTYVALLPNGILSSTTKPPLFISWDDMEDVSTFASGAQRAIGIRVRNAESIAYLHPFHKRMTSSRSFSGWDWGFGSESFEAKPVLVETALQYFYFHPEKRAEIGNAQNLITVQEAIAQKWQKPTTNAPIPEP
jgi:hypothetical protein